MTRPFITFTSDFSLRDNSVGTVKGVMWRIAPEAVIVDILHMVPDFDVLSGALTLANTLPYMAVGVHLAVVDPGVGTTRRPLAISTVRGDYLVGPDNGLLLPAAEALGGTTAAHELANVTYMLTPRSATFHGRDIFGPAAAHLSLGVPMHAFGPPVDLATLISLEIPPAAWHDDGLHATVLSIDHYGNLRLNARAADLREHGLAMGQSLTLRIGTRSVSCPWQHTFGDAAPGSPVLLEDSYWRLCLAINRGNAARAYGAERGTPVVVMAR